MRHITKSALLTQVTPGTAAAIFTFQLLYAILSFRKRQKTLPGRQTAAHISMRQETRHCMITEADRK